MRSQRAVFAIFCRSCGWRFGDLSFSVAKGDGSKFLGGRQLRLLSFSVEVRCLTLEVITSMLPRRLDTDGINTAPPPTQPHANASAAQRLRSRRISELGQHKGHSCYPSNLP